MNISSVLQGAGEVVGAVTGTGTGGNLAPTTPAYQPVSPQPIAPQRRYGGNNLPPRVRRLIFRLRQRNKRLRQMLIERQLSLGTGGTAYNPFMPFGDRMKGAR